MLTLILSCCPTCCSKIGRHTCEQGMQASFSFLGQSICSSSLSHIHWLTAVQLQKSATACVMLQMCHAFLLAM